MTGHDTALIEEASALSKAAGHPYADVLRRLVNALDAAQKAAAHWHGLYSAAVAGRAEERVESNARYEADRAEIDYMRRKLTKAYAVIDGGIAHAQDVLRIARGGHDG